jgi:stage V sporulation protein K
MEQMQRFRTSKRLKRPPVSYHAVLVGNPGTGKTTVARLYGRILYEAGLLRCGHFVEARRGELVGKYLGQTAPKVAAKVEEALGGVLFIDEAYALARKDSGDSYGDEAIDTLVPLMENHRDDLVVLLAGYEKEMETFMRRNPGLDSRISTWFRFPDFDPEELLHILDGLCEHYDYELSEQARERAYLEFIAAYERRGIEYGNARLARKMFEASITNHARRLAYCALSKNEERLLTPQDVPACTSLQ